MRKFNILALTFALCFAFVLSSGAGFAAACPCTDGQSCTITSSCELSGAHSYIDLTLSGVTLSTDSASLAINAANILGGGSISTPATSTYNSGGAVTITATNKVILGSITTSGRSGSTTSSGGTVSITANNVSISSINTDGGNPTTGGRMVAVVVRLLSFLT